MDPIACLAEIRELGEQIRNGDVRESVIEDYTSAVVALDEWLSKGGFLPTAWEGNRTVIWELTDHQRVSLYQAASGARRMRVAVDGGELKWDGGTGWIAGIESTKVVQQG